MRNLIRCQCGSYVYVQFSIKLQLLLQLHLIVAAPVVNELLTQRQTADFKLNIYVNTALA